MSKATNRYRLLSREYEEVLEAISNSTSARLIALLEERKEELSKQMRAISEANPSLFDELEEEDDQIRWEEEMGMRDDSPCLDMMAYHGPWHG